ncbi:MAG: galactose oxidase [Opitutaceae bacterium]
MRLRFFRVISVSLALIGALQAAEPVASGTLQWSALAPLPDREGFAYPFAGVHRGALLVAGGANFPDKKPWEGGTKVWYDTVFVLERPDGAWRVAGKLPAPLGYGVSITTPDGVLCLGGSDVQRHHAGAFFLGWESGKVTTRPFPSLPRPIANACGALLGTTVYVAGGIATPDATDALSTFWAIDLSAARPAWREMPAWPGPGRMLAVAAVADGAFFLVSGTSLAADAQGKPARTYLKDAYRYDPARGWRQIADIPLPAVAAPTPAPRHGARGFAVLGGDDASRLNVTPLSAHPGFPGESWVYDPAADQWRNAGRMPAAPVTVPVVEWEGRHVIPSGEIRPGVRTPAVWSLQAPTP